MKINQTREKKRDKVAAWPVFLGTFIQQKTSPPSKVLCIKPRTEEDINVHSHLPPDTVYTVLNQLGDVIGAD
jgi:hypothetical protein